MNKYITNAILIFLAVLFQLNFINFLPPTLKFINPLLIIIIIIMITQDLKQSLIWCLVVGFFIDLYSFLNFGTYIFTYILTIIITYYLFQKFITNKTLYTFLVLTFFSSLIFYTLLAFSSLFVQYFGFSSTV